ncbi:MAG TPA: TatD family hydrolase [Planktothrix sp.]|jgi:TatD DNase family protein
MPAIIDSHAHVVREFFPEDQEEVIARAFESGVVQMVNPGVVLDNLDELAELANRYERLYIAVGLHPHEAKHWSAQADAVVRQAAKNPKVVGIGECGLDFYYNNSERADQLNAFRAQIRIARELNKPVIVHCRDAWDDAFDLLEEEGQGNVRGVFHCFTGGPEMLSRINKLDFYISFSGIVTYKNAKNIQDAAREAPDNRIIVETDCPFLAPQKMRGKRNEPSYVWHVAEKLAELRHRSLDEISLQCCDNTRELFGLPAV